MTDYTRKQMHVERSVAEQVVRVGEALFEEGGARDIKLALALNEMRRTLGQPRGEPTVADLEEKFESEPNRYNARALIAAKRKAR
jgi:hypothetical protein